jgi:hypothetical protein
MEQEVNTSFMFSVNYPATSVGSLNELLSLTLQPIFAELWLSRLGAALAIYKNGDRAFVMFLRYEGDAGFHSFNPNYTGRADVTLELFMQNGQIDKKPVADWISVEDAKQAAEHFFLYGERAPWLTWHDDSHLK